MPVGAPEFAVGDRRQTDLLLFGNDRLYLGPRFPSTRRQTIAPRHAGCGPLSDAVAAEGSQRDRRVEVGSCVAWTRTRCLRLVRSKRSRHTREGGHQRLRSSIVSLLTLW